MRPIVSGQSHLRAPLNEILGTPANIRLIRVLAGEVSGPIGASEAAELAGLTESGARQALKRLARTSFVDQVGGGRAQRFILRDSEALSQSLQSLFGAERERYQAFISQLRHALADLLEVLAAWLEEQPTAPAQPAIVAVLADSRSLGHLREQVRRRILDIEQRFDTTIELHMYSQADAPETNWQELTMLAGHPPADISAPRSQDERESRGAILSEAIASMLDRDPSLLVRAQRHVELLLQDDQGPAAHDLAEWRNLFVHYSPQRIKEFLISDAPRAIRLRQSSPFFAVLNADERDQLIAMVEDRE